MSFEVANEQQSLGQFASNGGYSDFVAAVKTPALRSLVEHGASEDVPALLKELKDLIDNVPEDVASTAKALRDLIDGEEVIVITSGVVDDDEEAEKSDITLTASIVAKQEDQHLVFGWASIVERGGKTVTDSQGDQISPAQLEESAYEFVLVARKAGEMHEVIGVGRLVESCVFTAEKVAAMRESLLKEGITATLDFGCVPWWIGFKIDDQETWEKVKTGKLQAFSIGGRGKRLKIG